MASKYYDSSGKEVVTGEVALAADLNTINSAIDSGFQIVVTDIAAVETDAEDWADLAEQWAEEVEDTEVVTGQYSALHHAAKAADSAAAAASDAVDTAADLVLTNADVVSTGDDATDTAADLVATNQDTIDTAADLVLTNADVVLTNADVVLTNADVVSCGDEVDNCQDEVVLCKAEVVLCEAEVSLANEWAEKAEDSAITGSPGEYSALHWAAKAAEAATKPGKNLLYNGTFVIAQQDGFIGGSPISAGEYTKDGWKGGASGCTFTWALSGNVRTITITAGTLVQVVEGKLLQDGTIVLSWEGTAQGRIAGGSYGASGVTATQSGDDNISIEFSTGTVSLPQLEYGSTATTFEVRPYHEELQICKRYWQTNVIGSNTAGGILARAITSGRLTGFDFPVEMRSTPSVVLRSPNESIRSTPESICPYDNYNSLLTYGPSAAVVSKTGVLYANLSVSSATTGNYYSYKYEANARL